jgi:hypothetical protein
MTLRGDNCFWQQLMNGPYDRWQKHNGKLEQQVKDEKLSIRDYRRRSWGFKEMLVDACNPVERAACVLGKLNQQVENGGFAQWVDNQYAVDSWDWLPDLLEDMGPASQKVLAMCKQIMGWVEEDTGGFAQDEDSEYDWEHVICPLSDRLSAEFYELEDEWHEEVYAYLEKLKNELEPARTG